MGLIEYGSRKVYNMHCRECGQEVNENTEICINCGVRPLNGTNFCQDCGVETSVKQELCTSCGVRLRVHTVSNSPFGNVKGSGSMNTDFSSPNLSEYYQEEFNKILKSNEEYKGKFNWASFFFGTIWALTKGAWLNALVAFLVVVFTNGLLGIPMSIYYGFRGNYIYYKVYTSGQQNTF